MSRICLFPCLLMSAVMVSGAVHAAPKVPAPAAKTEAPKAMPAPDTVTLAPSIPRILNVPLSGGVSGGGESSPALEAWFVPNHTAPVISLVVQFPKSGYAYDPEKKQGLAFLASQLLMEGAGSYDAIAFQQLLDANAIQLSADVDEDRLSIRVTTLREKANVAFALLRDVVAQPRFDAEAVDRLKVRIASDIRRLEESPSYLAGKLWRQTVYQDHPYHHSKRGEANSVSTLTREDLLAWQKQHLTSGSIQIAISGDTNETEVQRLLVPVVQSLPVQVADAAALPFSTMKLTPKPLVQQFKGPQTQFIFSYPGLTRQDPQYFTLMVLNQILGGQSMGSRLSGAIRDRGGMAYSVNTVIDTNAASAMLMGFFSTRNARASEAFTLMMQEIVKLATGGATDEEVNNAKSYLIGSLPVQLDGTESMASFIAVLQRHELSRDYFTTRDAALQAVTRQDVNKLAHRMLLTIPMVVAVGAPEKSIEFP